jgi:RimJ/RimL family protein N-acetyltransferase
VSGPGAPREISNRLETQRLILRAPEERDLDGWADFVADEAATEFLGGVQSRNAAWRNLATEAGSWRLKGYGMYSVLDRQDGRCIGRVGPHWPEGYPALEVGWGIMPSHWGRGLALEAATAAIDTVFRELACDEILHLIDPGNLRSIRLARKLGARRGARELLPEPYACFTVDGWRLSRSIWCG